MYSGVFSGNIHCLFNLIGNAVKYTGEGRIRVDAGLRKELVAALGGTCGCSSTEGVGSHFWVMLPIVEFDNEKGEPSAGRTVRQISPQFSDLVGLRVLVADDEPIKPDTLSSKVCYHSMIKKISKSI